ncbi:MAG: hypothetical protein KJ709_01630 [Nanoarchaeota archaeon]|nr:hypothetical protein [Nanoarchaeota archaeon]
MEWKKMFKPNLWKIVFSIIITASWFFILKKMLPMVLCDCIMESPLMCKDYYNYLLINHHLCGCGCTPFIDVVVQYLLFIIVPFIVAYIVFSLLQLVLSRKK